jgi:Protein of unknown function (DUF2971)
MISVPQTTVPLTLYKYFPPERVDIIPVFQVRFSPPSEFNDAFDTYPLVRRDAGPLAKVERSKLRSALGVLCLTEEADNHLMWVNYARAHTGFVLGFKADALFFEQDNRSLRKVIYQSSPPVLSPLDENGCFYKPGDWAYEKEWRCVRSFGKSESRLVEFEPALITEVVFGYRMERPNMSKIIYYAKALETYSEMKPTFSVSSPSHVSWKFVNRPKKVSSCSHCESEGFFMEDL